MKPEIIYLFDEYTHGTMDRRVFLERLAGLAGGVAVATSMLALLEPNPALAESVYEGDPRIRTDKVRFPGSSGPVDAYVVRPSHEGEVPGVLIIHENRGLNAYIKDVARRVAIEGFMAVAPDALSPLGGTPSNANEARAMFRDLDKETTIEDFQAAIRYLRFHEECNGNVGCVGFCWGGGMVGDLAIRSRVLKAAVSFYGRQPRGNDARRIRAKLMLHYAGLDRRINAGIEKFEAALKKARVDYTLHMYEGVHHAFHNNTSRARYNATAARRAWLRTVAFLKQHLN